MQAISLRANHDFWWHSFPDADRRYLAHPRKAYNLAGRVLLPLTALIPESLSARTTIIAVLEALLIALPCFIAGLFARTI
jgi:hypothetical protein